MGPVAEAVARRGMPALGLYITLFIGLALLFSLPISKSRSLAWQERPPKPLSALYGADPLELIAGYDLTTHYTLDEDLWDVWICEVAEGDLDLALDEVVHLLESEITPYFDWLSEGRYRPVFRVGGTMKVDSFDNRADCFRSVWKTSINKAPEDRAEGTILIVNKASYASFGSLGAISYISPVEAALRTTTFPTNNRFVYLDGRSVVEPGSWSSRPADRFTQPNLFTVAHELGHAVGFPHSYRFTRYDNPMEIMGDNDAVLGLQIGTIAINRYAAGWMDAQEVAIYEGGGNSRYTLSPPGDHRTQMLVLGSDDGSFVTLGARVRKGYDSGLPKEGVESYLIEQQSSICFHYPGYEACIGTARPTRAIFADPTSPIDQDDPVAHVMGVGDGFTWRETTVTVIERIGDDFVVEVNDHGTVDIDSSEAANPPLVMDP